MRARRQTVGSRSSMSIGTWAAEWLQPGASDAGGSAGGERSGPGVRPSVTEGRWRAGIWSIDLLQPGASDAVRRAERANDAPVAIVRRGR